MNSDSISSTKELWSAVLLQAINDIRKPIKANRNRIRDDAIFWINNREDIGINSFCGICNTFKLDPDTVRDSILNNNFGG